MIRRAFLPSALASLLLLGAAAAATPQNGGATAPTPTTPPPAGKSPALSTGAARAGAPTSPLDRFKAMAGDWNVDLDGDGKTDTVVNYRIIANGSAVVETDFPGTDHEMITVYTLDRGVLTLTHYCALGNQPRLKAAKDTGNKVSFEFVDGGNLASRDQDHMDSVTIDFVGPDHVVTQWRGYKDGQSSDHARFDMRRATPAQGGAGAPAAPTR